VLTSAHADAGLTALEAHIAPGDTVAFIGPSGVGKSSLINRLAGEERQTVRDVRERDMKGRHTTTRRELIPITHGALLIDTPGVREFAVLADDGVAGFTDIDQLAEHCKFPDCQHAAEPECAVRAAIERGELPEDRLASYLSIASDAERLAAKHDPYSRHLEKQEGKRFGRLVRSVTRLKDATAAPRLKPR
jgi:ribosome biogenesis GTPase / thiamine phosphate phosphatase